MERICELNRKLVSFSKRIKQLKQSDIDFVQPPVISIGNEIPPKFMIIARPQTRCFSPPKQRCFSPILQDKPTYIARLPQNLLKMNQFTPTPQTILLPQIFKEFNQQRSNNSTMRLTSNQTSLEYLSSPKLKSTLKKNLKRYKTIPVRTQTIDLLNGTPAHLFR